MSERKSMKYDEQAHKMHGIVGLENDDVYESGNVWTLRNNERCVQTIWRTGNSDRNMAG